MNDIEEMAKQIAQLTIERDEAREELALCWELFEPVTEETAKLRAAFTASTSALEDLVDWLWHRYPPKMDGGLPPTLQPKMDKAGAALLQAAEVVLHG